MGSTPFRLFFAFSREAEAESMTRFDTAQALDLTGLSKEALRYWKSILSPIRGRDGRSQGYTFQEVAALAVISRAVQELAVPISRFASKAAYIFSEIAVHTQSRGEPLILCITQEDMMLISADQLPGAETMALVRIDQVLQTLRNAIGAQPSSGEAQLDLPFHDARIVGFRSRR
jgi:hypothetical protein